jgi:hypothetical protein
MARGGYGGGTGIPLQDRVRGATPPAASSARGVGAGDDCPARHCWVAVPVDGSRPRPGLLLEWRKVERGRFEGLVTYAAQLRPGRWTTVTEWVPAELLTQADSP